MSKVFLPAEYVEGGFPLDDYVAASLEWLDEFDPGDDIPESGNNSVPPRFVDVPTLVFVPGAGRQL